LLRVHVLLCDYTSALQVIQRLDLRRHKAILTSVPSCYLSLYYYLSYSSLMLGRYTEAQRYAHFFFTSKARIKQMQQKINSSPLLTKKVEQLQGILAMAAALSVNVSGLSLSLSGSSAGSSEIFDGSSGDSVMVECRDKIGVDRFNRLYRYDVAAYEDLFFLSAPKCLLLYNNNNKILDDDDEHNQHDAVSVNVSSSFSPQEFRRQQWFYFSLDISQRSELPPLLSYLTLFSSVSLSKLSAFLNCNEDETIAALFLCCSKSKPISSLFPNNANGPANTPLSNQQRSVDQIDLVLDGDRVEIRREVSVRRYGEFFTRQIQRLAEIQKEVHSNRER